MVALPDGGGELREATPVHRPKHHSSRTNGLLEGEGNEAVAQRSVHHAKMVEQPLRLLLDPVALAKGAVQREGRFADKTYGVLAGDRHGGVLVKRGGDGAY